MKNDKYIIVQIKYVFNFISNCKYYIIQTLRIYAKALNWNYFNNELNDLQ